MEGAFREEEVEGTGMWPQTERDPEGPGGRARKLKLAEGEQLCKDRGGGRPTPWGERAP